MHETLAQKIIEQVSKGPTRKAALIEGLSKKSAVTPQAVYKALRQLQKEEIVVLHKSEISLSIVWIQKEFDRISEVASTYQAPVYQSYFGSLKPGQKVSYHFKTLKELDLFWTHSVLITVRGAHRDTPIISLVPHDWFELLRPETAGVWDTITGAHNPHFAVMTHSTTEEKKKSKHIKVKTFERMFNANPLKQKESVYINILGDLIFEARLDEKVLPAIRAIMRDPRGDITGLFDAKGGFRLAIECNPKKALATKKKLQKYFVGKLF